MTKKYNIPLVVRSSFNDNEGTIVKEVNSVEKLLVSGVACDKDIARVAVIGVENIPGKAFQIFSLLAKENINVDIILQSIGREKTKDISFTVSKSNLKQTLDVLTKNLHIIGAKDITYADNVAKVSIVGAGMVNNPGVAAMMFEALYDAGINIEMISTSEIKISVLIDEKDAEKAVRAIHDKFKLHLLNSNGK